MRDTPQTHFDCLVIHAGFKPATPTSVVWYSIQLSSWTVLPKKRAKVLLIFDIHKFFYKKSAKMFTFALFSCILHHNCGVESTYSSTICASLRSW